MILICNPSKAPHPHRTHRSPLVLSRFAHPPNPNPKISVVPKMKRGRPPKSESSKKADSKLAVKKRSDKGLKRAKKPAKDPNKPKRPPSAFFVFMEEFRKQFKEKNPNNKSVAAVGKAGGEKWKSLSESEKAPYVAKAEKRKSEYTKTLAAYNKKQAGGSSSHQKDDDDESDKSKSEVHDGEDEEESGEEDDEDDED